jgi:predicted HTH domain antitoxin
MQITIDMPDSFMKEISFSFTAPEREIKFILASKLVESGRISTGKAAEWIGVSKPRFLQEMGRYGVSIFPVDELALEKDVSNARNGYS